MSSLWWRSFSRSANQKCKYFQNKTSSREKLRTNAFVSAAFLAGTGCVLPLSLLSEDINGSTSIATSHVIEKGESPFWPCAKTLCDEFRDDTDQLYPSGYAESDRFFHCLEYHRSLYKDYSRRWIGQDGGGEVSSITWPRKIPKDSEISGLEFDFEFCLQSPSYRGDASLCQDKKFQIATYYINQSNIAAQQQGVRMIKELAAHGHPDGMCMYGIILNEGKITGIEAHPELAVVWWRRCVDFHRHISATYELALALYTGEGAAENPELAISFFSQAAHLGHAGAAYMLGECLLDGVGVQRDRAIALEWLVTAAELGHHLARKRVLVILQQEYDELVEGHGKNAEGTVESQKWVGDDVAGVSRDVNIERRFTIGGGSSNPQILARRQTKVAESRDPEDF